MKKIVFATHNDDKAKELKEILSEYEILTLKDIDFPGEIEENGETIEENALIKARAAYEFSGMTSVADDTGLFVDALGGRPGVYSSRYSGGGYEDNVNKLLGELEGVPSEKRGASFRCSAAMVSARGEASVTAEVPGTITDKSSGTGGFGYDPVFRESSTGLTYAEMDAEEKNSLSHRKKAFEMLKSYIEKDEVK
ncbi:MAG: RdgB/HAM1 family non-canonical purine NTP pyrophosphatase [Eubacteriaceae bacterium]|nr:RdgB/HAM1 family non-canonical purine NTP pyrophosphatase [Eubacteriaceae bacterium]